MEVKRAEHGFQLVAASYLIRICGERARTLSEMGRHLRTCADASIFYHTYQSLETHHYTSFSSDFAQWILAACNEAALAERLGMVDLREFVSIADLRDVLAGAVEGHIAENPASGERPAFEPFHFCEAVEVTVPLEEWVHTLPELAVGIRRLSLHSLHYHFISSRLRLRLQTNDFSNWVEHSLQMPALAARLNRIDFYNETLDEVRRDVLAALENSSPQ